MIGSLKKPIWIIPVLVLVMAIGAFAAVVAINHSSAPTAEALVVRPFSGFAFGVGQTNTLQSFNQNGDAFIMSTLTDDGPGTGPSEEQFSGYDFTVRSDTDLVGGETMTVTFVTDNQAEGEFVDLGDLVPASVLVGDEVPVPAADVDVTQGVAAVVGVAGEDPFIIITLPDGMNDDDGAGGEDPDNIIEAGENINVRILESSTGGIRNPSTASEDNQIMVLLSNAAGPATSAKYSFGPRVTLSPDDPGASTRITFEFFLQNNLVANDGQLRFQFDKDWKNIPTTMSASSITIRADRVLHTDGMLCAPLGVGECSSNQVVNPFEDPSFDLVGSEHADVEISVRIGDADPSTSDETGVGNQDLAEGALVSVSFSNASGITVPTEGNTAFQSHGSSTDEIDVAHSNAISTDFETVGEVEPRINRVLELDSDDGTLGEQVTIVGKGFKGGSTLTLFVDTNGDGKRQNTESALLTGVPVGSDDTFTVDFTVTSAIQAGGDNLIQVIDGEGNGACRLTTGSAGRCADADDAAEFKLKGRVIVSPDTAGRGDTITITLEDWAENEAVLSATIGGACIEIPGLTYCDGGGTTPGTAPMVTNAEVTFTTTVPNDAPLGNTLLIVATPGEDEDTDFTTTGATLNLSLAEAVPNQSLTLSGTGYTDDSSLDPFICESNITIAEVAIQFDPDTATDSRTTAELVAAGCAAGDLAVDVTSGGTWVTTIIVPVESGTLRDGIAHEVKVTDSSGREGTKSLLFPERTMMVTPLECGTRCIIQVFGTGFPADNDDGVAVNINVRYDCGGSCSDNDNVDTDTAGRFTAELEVPARAPIPSDNTISAVITADGVVQTPRPTVKHFIPQAEVELSLSKGPSGIMVDLTGRFFSAFTAVERVEFGGLNALGSRSPNTDSSGSWEITGLLVPDLDEGIHSVIARIGTDDREVTANTIFEVTTRGLIGVPTTAAEAMTPLTDDNLLERAFHFNNANKVWTFYDPRPEFADSNTIEEFFSGGVYWIKVTQDTEVILNNQTRNLACLSAGTPEEDCWSLIVW